MSSFSKLSAAASVLSSWVQSKLWGWSNTLHACDLNENNIEYITLSSSDPARVNNILFHARSHTQGKRGSKCSNAARNRNTSYIRPPAGRSIELSVQMQSTASSVTFSALRDTDLCRNSVWLTCYFRTLQVTCVLSIADWDCTFSVWHMQINKSLNR